MTEIKRYEMNHKGLPEFDDKGVWVLNDDHAAIVAAKDARIAELQEQVRALAAESVELKSAFNPEEISEEAVEAFTETTIMDHDWDETGSWSWIDNDTDVIRAVLAAIKPETPATDAALRDVREQAVNGFSEFCGDNSVFIKETCNYDSLADAACIYLAHIREGEQP